MPAKISENTRLHDKADAEIMRCHTGDRRNSRSRKQRNMTRAFWGIPIVCYADGGIALLDYDSPRGTETCCAY
jgi:hypothetical protein